MRPLEFCDLAERLIQNEKNAAGFRTAISRAYYRAFLQARDFLLRMPVYLVAPNPHVEVIALVSNSGDAVALLLDLRDRRNTADYDLNDPSVENEAEATRCVNSARDIIAKLNGCRISPSRFGSDRPGQTGEAARAEAPGECPSRRCARQLFSRSPVDILPGASAGNSRD